MYPYNDYCTNLYLEHHGILGQKWGIRRYQNEDGTLTELGKKRLDTYKEKEIAKIKNDRYKDIKTKIINDMTFEQMVTEKKERFLKELKSGASIGLSIGSVMFAPLASIKIAEIAVPRIKEFLANPVFQEKMIELGKKIITNPEVMSLATSSINGSAQLGKELLNDPEFQKMAKEIIVKNIF